MGGKSGIYTKAQLKQRLQRGRNKTGKGLSKKGRKWDASKPRNNGLISDRHMRVIDEYEKIQFASQKQALIAAGYSFHTANSNAWQVFHRPEVRAEIEKRKAKYRMKVEVTEDMIMNRLRMAITVNPGEILQKLHESNFDLSVLTEEEKFLVSELSQTKMKIDGRVSTRNKVKIESAMKAVELAGRKLGMWKDKMEVTAPGMDVVSLLQQGRQRVGKKAEGAE